MKIRQTICLSLLLFISCKNAAHHEAPVNHLSNVVIANKFVEAFYSFNSDSLASMLSLAQESQPNILYYQKWAECGHYEIVKRDMYIEKNDSLILFPVTVKDDLMAALKIKFNVTDTFRISVRNGQIRSVQTSSNDPEKYYEAKEWVKKNRPDLVKKACEGIWEGGPTPCECIQGMLKGFAEFIEKEKQTKL
ncbi:MAG: hypothetical protein ABI663_09335 [Chryseolinea sp.]